MREAERLIKSFYDFKDACSDEPKEKSNTVKERQRRNKLGAAFSDSIINNVRSTIKKPAVGSLVYCDLAFSTVEHTGIERKLGNGARNACQRKSHVTLHLTTPHLGIHHIIIQ